MFLHRFVAALLPAVFLICGQAEAQETSGPTPRNLYTLPVGAQVEFETSASAALPGRDGTMIPVSATLMSSFTVLRVDGNVRTLLASVQPTQIKQGSDAPTTDTSRNTFTFEMTADGEIGRYAGRLGNTFPGWSPEVLFPAIPETSGSGVTLPIPLLDAAFTTTASREVREEAVLAQAELRDASPNLGVPVTISEYRWKAEYEPSVSTLRSTALSVVLSMAAPERQTKEFSLSAETRRTAQRNLDTSTVAALQQDAAAGIAVLNKLQSGAAAPGAADVEEAIESYLDKHPSGEFSALFRGFLGEVKNMAALRENFEKLQPGTKAPDFRASSIDDEPVNLADYRGKVVLLDFWATWCGPCVAARPALKRLHEEYSDKGFAIIGISGDHDVEALRRFVKRMDLAWKQIWVPEPAPGTVMHQYGVTRFPTSVLVDREGVIKAVDLRGEELEQAVSELLK